MATIRKHRDQWQAQIRLKGIKPIAKSFAKKADAVAWARVAESRVTLGTYVDPRAAENTLVSDLLERYVELLRLRIKFDAPVKSRLERLRCSLGAFSLAMLSMCHLTEYRDQRLLAANPATVIHELSLLRRVLRLASTEWGIPFPQGVPTIRLPKMPRGRTRRLGEGEEETLLSLCVNDPVLHDFIELAIETAMRRSELVSMRWDDIDWQNSTLYIPLTKTGIPRTIPLSSKAASILKSIQRTDARVFGITATSASQRFSKLCFKAQILDLRLHDLRHEAITRFFEIGLNSMEVAAISGHQTLTMLGRYTHLDPSRLVQKLESFRQEI